MSFFKYAIGSLAWLDTEFYTVTTALNQTPKLLIKMNVYKKTVHRSMLHLHQEPSAAKMYRKNLERKYNHPNRHKHLKIIKRKLETQTDEMGEFKNVVKC